MISNYRIFFSGWTLPLLLLSLRLLVFAVATVVFIKRRRNGNILVFGGRKKEVDNTSVLVASCHPLNKTSGEFEWPLCVSASVCVCGK